MQIVTAPAQSPPFACEVFVREEDRGLVLSASTTVVERGDTLGHLSNLLDADSVADPPPVGELVTRGQRWFAVIHDLDCSPSTGEDVVLQALLTTVAEVDRLGIDSIALDALGSMHGVLPQCWAIDAASQILAASCSLSRAWIVTR